MSKPIDDLLPQVLPHAPSCPVPTARSYIREAAMAFCERTRLWRHSATIAVGTGDIAVPLPAGALLFEIETALYNGYPLKATAPTSLDGLLPGWRDGIGSGMPQYITQVSPNTVRLAPSESGNVELHLFLKPDEDALELPDFLVDDYRRTIAHGALAELLMLPGQPFSDPVRAGYFDTRFRGALDRLSDANMRGQQRAPVRTKPRYM